MHLNLATSQIIPIESGRVQQPSFVSVKRLNKGFGNGRRVLNELSFDVQSGEFVSLIGPSGCGKSTILRLLSGLMTSCSGSITIDGMTTQNAREITSFVFQDATLLPWRTVEKNVALTLELEGISLPRRSPKIKELLTLVGLQDAADLYPRQLSGGMKMRVSIARALASSPKLLLMDEPFGALDEMTRNRLNEELLRIKQQQKWTAFFVTHSVAEAVFLSNRVFVLQANPGRLAYDIPIDLPDVRTAELRSSPHYLKLVGEVSAALHKAHTT
jgi:NitT/TauT family transport system ATP-binding protein